MGRERGRAIEEREREGCCFYFALKARTLLGGEGRGGGGGVEMEEEEEEVTHSPREREREKALSASGGGGREGGGKGELSPYSFHLRGGDRENVCV